MVILVLCKMATMGKTEGAMFTGVEWSSSPVTFHENKGKNIRLSEGNKVATRVDKHSIHTSSNYSDAIVFTAEPLSVGQLLRVTMTKRAKWGGTGLVSCVSVFS